MTERYDNYRTLFEIHKLNDANVVIVGLGPLAQHLGLVVSTFGIKNINYIERI